jgi:hypothetical protein
MSKNNARKFLVIAALLVGGTCIARPAMAVTDANGITLLGGGNGGSGGSGGNAGSGGNTGSGGGGSTTAGGGGAGGSTATGGGGGGTGTAAPGTVTRDVLLTYTVTINWFRAGQGFQPRTYTVRRTYHYYDGSGWQMSGDEWTHYTAAWTKIAGNGWTASSNSVSAPVVSYF